VPRTDLAVRVSRRVDDQFRRGVVAEVQTLLARGVPTTAHAFSGLVYRQVMEFLQGVRDEPATRELIVRENLRYAKRQLTWFRKEPNVHWFDATADDTPGRVQTLVRGFLGRNLQL
jgi:tRNA dimethylallyltransferase